MVPVGRVGLYVPGGVAPLVSSVVMTWPVESNTASRSRIMRQLLAEGFLLALIGAGDAAAVSLATTQFWAKL